MDKKDIEALPDNIKAYIKSLEQSNESLQSLQNENSSLLKKTEKLEAKVEDLSMKLDLFRQMKFGISSEKLDPSQFMLFEEEEYEDTAEAKEETTTVPSHERKKAGRKPLDPTLPRKRIVHDIPEEDKKCACGCNLVQIGEEISERLQVEPEKFFVEQHVRPKYACRKCEGSGDEEKPVFRVASAPPSLIPGSIMTSGLLAFILTNKFCDHMPFYRQEKRFERIGINLSRQNMSNWTVKAHEVLKPMENLMREMVKQGNFLQMDETPIQVLKEKDKKETSKSYMWLTRGGPSGKTVILYEYNKSRSSQYVKEFTEEFSGFVQTDGYQGYDAVFEKREDITHVGCLAHARRKFHTAFKRSKSPSATVVLNKIRKIYTAEKSLKKQNLSAEDFLEERKKQIKPMLDKLKKWLDNKNVRPSADIGQAVSYTLGQWEKIMKYLDCPELTPDNNAAERAIKPFVVGRKNWLFSGSPKGADALCFFFSLIETAKDHDLNPYGYLRWVFDKAVLINNENDFEKLLPWNCDRKQVNML